MYVGTSVEFFLSNFRHEVPEMDVEKMVQIYANELPRIYEEMEFTPLRLQEIERKLLFYIRNYINKKGGIEKLKLYTEEELDEIFDISIQEIFTKLGLEYPPNKY